MGTAAEEVRRRAHLAHHQHDDLIVHVDAPNRSVSAVANTSRLAEAHQQVEQRAAEARGAARRAIPRRATVVSETRSLTLMPHANTVPRATRSRR